MSAMSDYLEGQLRAHIFRTASYTKPTVLGFSLCSASPTDAGTGASQSELTSTGSYNRVDVPPLDANWTAPDATGGLTDNVADITFPTASANWSATVSHCAVNSSATIGAGNMLLHGALTASKTVQNGDIFKFAIGAFDVTFA
jgi:hypothetical protein